MTFLKNAPQPTEEQLAKIACLEQEAKRSLQSAEDSFQRCDTDGFLSQWASQINAELRRKEAKLLRNGGYAEFPVLCDSEGNVVADRIYRFADKFAPEWSGKTVSRWKLPDDLAEKHNRRWVPVAYVKTGRIQKQLGLHEEFRWFPAHAEITTGGRKSTGLSGCANAYVAVFKDGEGDA